MARFGQTIKALRAEKNIPSQAELAARSSVHRNTINKIERLAETPDDVDEKTLKLLALGLSMTPEALIQVWADRDAKARPFSQQVEPAGGVPVFDEVPAGNGDFDPTAIGEDNGYAIDIFPFKTIPPAARKFKQLYAVVVKGDSMSPDINDGDTVFCASDAEHVDGMVAAYRLEDGDCGLKMIELHGEEAVLVPRNPKYPKRRVMRSEFIRVGRMVAQIKATI